MIVTGDTLEVIEQKTEQLWTCVQDIQIHVNVEFVNAYFNVDMSEDIWEDKDKQHYITGFLGTQNQKQLKHLFKQLKQAFINIMFKHKIIRKEMYYLVPESTKDIIVIPITKQHEDLTVCTAVGLFETETIKFKDQPRQTTAKITVSEKDCLMRSDEVSEETKDEIERQEKQE